MFAREFADWMFAFGNIMQKGATKVTDWPELIVALLIYIMVPLGIVEVGNGYLTRMIVIAGRVAFMTQNLELWLSSRKYINGAAQTFTDIIRDYMQKVLDYGKTIFRAYGVFCIFGPKLWYMSESFKFQCLPEIPRAFCWLMNLAGSLCYIISIICLSWALISWFASLKLEKSQTINIDNEKMVRHIYEDIEKEKPSPEKKEEVKKEVFSRIGKLKTGYVWYAIHYFTWDLLMNWYGKFWIIAPMFFFGLFVTNLQASYGLMSQALSIANEFHASMIFVAFMWGDFQTYRVLRDNLFSFTKSLESKPYPKDPFRRERRRETAEKAE
jgi:ABC-type long-subunit fatty acid transport system fused permease/ATPase subunit